MRDDSKYTREFLPKMSDLIIECLARSPKDDLIYKYRRGAKSVRAGWRAAIGYTTLTRMALPAVLINDVCFLFRELCSSFYSLKLREFHSVRVVRLKIVVNDSTVHSNECFF